MKKLIVFYLLLFVSLGVIAGGVEDRPLPSPVTGEETDIFLLGQEPKDDTSINGKVGKDSEGKPPSAQSFTAGIGDTVVVHLSDKDKSLINNANCLESDGTDKKDCNKKNIAIYLDGRSVGERKYDELLNANRIEFRLGYQDNKDYSNKHKWQELLGSPTWVLAFSKSR